MRGILFLFVAGAAQAHEGEHDHGFYLGGGFAVGLEQARIPSRYSRYDNLDEAHGFDLWAGYRMNRFFGLEVEFLYIEGFDVEVENIDISFKGLGGTANLKLYPFNGRVEPYLLGGVGAEVGADIYIFDSVALVTGVDYLMTKNNVADFLEVKLGLQYRF